MDAEFQSFLIVKFLKVEKPMEVELGGDGGGHVREAGMWPNSSRGGSLEMRPPGVELKQPSTSPHCSQSITNYQSAGWLCPGPRYKKAEWLLDGQPHCRRNTVP